MEDLEYDTLVADVDLDLFMSSDLNVEASLEMHLYSGLVSAVSMLNYDLLDSVEDYFIQQYDVGREITSETVNLCRRSAEFISKSDFATVALSPSYTPPVRALGYLKQITEGL